MVFRHYPQLERDREVRVDSEDISSDVLNDTVAALLKRVETVDRRHDVPYLAGYSKDGGTVYIDRHMPRVFQYHGQEVETDRFLIVHEAVEKALLDEVGLHYVHAHQVALRTEQAAVRAAGIRWRDYDRFTKSNIKKIGDERITNVPKDLDLTPYRDEHDLETLRKLIDAG